MAWFTSIVQGVGSAMNWAISNAGDIGGLIESMRKVSSLYIPRTAAERALAPITSNDYFRAFRRADEYLLEKAQEKVKERKLEKKWDSPKRAVPIDGSLSGLWINPTVFTRTSKEVPEMYRDLVKLLAELRVPPIMKRDKEDVDVAELVAQAIFSFHPKPPSEIANFDASNVDHFPQYAIGLQDDSNSWQLFVGHAYYAMPMGRSGTDNIWHGAIYVEMLAADHVLDQHAKEMEEYMFMENIEPMAVDFWLSTFQVAWKAIKVARGGYKFIKEVLNDKDRKKPAGYKISYNFLDGQLQTIKIQAPADKNAPSEMLFYLQEAVADAVVKMNKSSDGTSYEVGGAATQYQTPQVALMDSTLIKADITAATDNMVVVSR